MTGLPEGEALTGQTVFLTPSKVFTADRREMWRAANLRLEREGRDGPVLSLLFFFPLAPGQMIPEEGRYERSAPIDIATSVPAPEEPVALVVEGGSSGEIRYSASAVEIDLREARDRRPRGEFTMTFHPRREPEGETRTAQGAFSGCARGGDRRPRAGP